MAQTLTPSRRAVIAALAGTPFLAGTMAAGIASPALAQPVSEGSPDAIAEVMRQLRDMESGAELTGVRSRHFESPPFSGMTFTLDLRCPDAASAARLAERAEPGNFDVTAHLMADAFTEQAGATLTFAAMLIDDA
jgi:hypothetical protein